MKECMYCGEVGKWKHHAPRQPNLIEDYYCPKCFISEAEQMILK